MERSAAIVRERTFAHETQVGIGLQAADEMVGRDQGAERNGNQLIEAAGLGGPTIGDSCVVSSASAIEIPCTGLTCEATPILGGKRGERWQA